MTALRLFVELWLRYRLLRLVTGFAAAFMVVLFLVMMTAYREVRGADLLEVSGHYAGYVWVEKYDNRFAILLDEYDSPFLIHAHGVGLFDEAGFIADVRAGDALFVSIERRRQAELESRDLLTAFAVRSQTKSYLVFEPVAAASRQEGDALPFLAGVGLIIAALSLAAAAGYKRVQHTQEGHPTR